MPELPEVETVKRTLIELVEGKEIVEVQVGWPKMIKRPDDVEHFKMLVRGQRMETIKRKGKFLIFHLSDYALVSHLRMEGKYSLVTTNEPDKHTHVRFLFTDGTTLEYQDVRKFGTMHLFDKGDELIHAPLNKLGPEPILPDFTAEYLLGKIKTTSRSIKAVLLDQSITAGLGNIYVDEALFRARIHPGKIASQLDAEEATRIVIHAKETLEDAIRAGGSSIRSYLNGNGDMGIFNNSYLFMAVKANRVKYAPPRSKKCNSGKRHTFL
ncbi:formamidopyrimidine-DNA glycosylase [Geomicrobium sp. JCM 19037]|nr:formamidopyrimidine-DNA glycosylase [Geomicrobium sp. JCM 19037]